MENSKQRLKKVMRTKDKKIPSYRFSLSSHLGDVIFIVIVLLVFSRFLTFPLGGPTPVSVISSDSMKPALNRGDVIFWYPCLIETIKPGDIVVYSSYLDSSTTIVHRVVKTVNDQQGIGLITKGDSNAYTDQSGPHATEPPIRSDHLLGKVADVGMIPLSIPLIGHIWLMAQGLSSGYTSYLGGSTLGLLVLIPFILAGLAILWVISAIVARPRNGSNEPKEPRSLHNHRKIPFKWVAFGIGLFFVILLCSTSLFSYSPETLSIGVQTRGSGPVDLQMDYLQPNNTTYANYYVTNPGFLTAKNIAFIEGDASQIAKPNESVFSLNAGNVQNKTISVTVPYGSQPRVYNGTLYVYTSAFWMIFPDDFINHVTANNPRTGMLELNLIVALILTVITLSLLITVNLLINEIILFSIDREAMKTILLAHSPLYKIRKQAKTYIFPHFKRSRIFFNTITRPFKDTNLVNFTYQKPLIIAMVCAVAFLPLTIWFSLGLGILLDAITVAVILNICGAHYRAEFYFSAAVSTLALILITFLIPVALEFPNGSINIVSILQVIQSISIASLMYLIFILPVCIIVYICAYIGTSLRDRKDPLAVVCDGDIKP